jgi:hypothetical protein
VTTVRFKWKILFGAACVGGLVALYGLWYLLSPESERPEYTAMRRYRMSSLSDTDLREIVAKARRDRQAYLAQKQAAAKEASEQALKEWEAREKVEAQCRGDPVFRLRNEDLCNGPRLGVGYIPGPAVPEVPTPSEDQLVEEYIMGPCLIAATVREARKAGCLAPR